METEPTQPCVANTKKTAVFVAAPLVEAKRKQPFLGRSGLASSFHRCASPGSQTNAAVFRPLGSLKHSKNGCFRCCAFHARCATTTSFHSFCSPTPEKKTVVCAAAPFIKKKNATKASLIHESMIIFGCFAADASEIQVNVVCVAAPFVGAEHQLSRVRCFRAGQL